MSQLLQQSRQFDVKGKIYTYEEDDPIYFLREPTSNRYMNLLQCNSCDSRFESDKQKHCCQFCGFANCKQCSRHTWYFFGHIPGSGDKNHPRGKVCDLCNRKFLVAQTYGDAFKGIDAQKEHLAATQLMVDGMQAKLSARQTDFDR